mmetsp:Transcript_29989/g.45469  ORF Transcript_29989/g.45469 Transcript_29989/m.45469 type:complete len:247 (-) Transcript_29989:142-882(-)|eukprot:CAMPEP_0178912116 /NCGR_PEP_ID=MMETSP0786-20121207/10079_1 /TAXON_ID=186022 /ORGANISM="Thalassionema frauenfeldii, Strain CCMP 1798" /LENGTH=246 /DNA_ID=CAMNT_0020584653 /DNA_START=46 /DNA_END=786 /DNA_ORIENTATION=-
MEIEILKKLAERATENSSINPYGSTSQIRATAKTQASATLAMLQSVRNGGLQSGPTSLGQSLFSTAGNPSSSMFEMALLQQRFALEEQSRMRVMAQAAVAARQHHHHHQQQNLQKDNHQQESTGSKRSSLSHPLHSSEALERLRKKRKLNKSHPLSFSGRVKNPKTGFILPKQQGKDYIPSIKSLESWKATWNKFIAKAKSKGLDEEEQFEFARLCLIKTLSGNCVIEFEDSSSVPSDVKDSNFGS